MTVCIGVICGGAKTIVGVSDHKISFGGVFSADNLATKVTGLHPDWPVFFAGSKIGQVRFVVARAAGALSKQNAVSQAGAIRALEAAYEEQLEQKRQKIVGRAGFKNMREFLREGKKRMAPSEFGKLSTRLAGISLGCEFLLAGFDVAKQAHLVYFDGESAESHDDIGFCAIGTGSPVAMSTLSIKADRYHLSPWVSVEEALYCACEAKFMAESAEGVGKATFVVVHKPGWSVRFVSHWGVEQLRKEWERHGPASMPKKFLPKIPQMIYSMDELKTQEGIEKFLGPKIYKKYFTPSGSGKSEPGQ